MKLEGEKVVRWETARQRKRSFLFSLFLFSSTTMLLDLLPATLPFFLLLSDFIVPFFPWRLSPLFSTLYPFPSYILLLPSLLLSVHDLLVISLNTVPPPRKKRAKGKAFGSMQDPFIVLLRGIKGKPGSTDPTSK